MKSVVLSCCICCLLAAPVFAQLNKVDEYKRTLETSNKDTIAWTWGGTFNLGMNEGILHNWSAGGELASFTVNTIFSGHLERLYHTNVWSNNLDVAYGLNYAYSQAFKPHKTDDRFDFTSRFSKKIRNDRNMYFTALFNMKSQFTKGYDYNLQRWDTVSTSRFFSPAYFITAIGMEFRKGSDISLFYSPVAGRLTAVDQYYTSRSKQGAFGVDYNKTVRYEFGSYISARYLTNINKHVSFKTRLDFYCNYLAKNTLDSMGNTVKRDNPSNISMLNDNLLVFKFSRRFNLTVGLTVVYDNNLPYNNKTTNSAGQVVEKDEPFTGFGWWQVKQNLSFGMEYKF